MYDLQWPVIVDIRTPVPSRFPEKQTISFWPQKIKVGREIFKTIDSIEIIKKIHQLFAKAKLVFNIYGSQASHKMVVMNVIAKSLTVVLYGKVWSINWIVYDFHVRSPQVYKTCFAWYLQNLPENTH